MLENEIDRLTWKTPVDVGFRYLVRIHLQHHLAENRGVSLKVLVNEMIVVDAKISMAGDEYGILQHRGYVVAVKGRKQEGRRDLSINLQSNDEFIDGHKLIKGFEIFKLSNPDNNLASPNAFPQQRDSPSWIIWNSTATLAIAILVLINVFVHTLREICEASVTEEENRPSARAERICRRFSLAEIQCATKDFSETLLIGRGGFGKVYKGLIDNGQETVAIKRLKSNSSQGRHEFLTEIETLSELRHINLVSLIGYCIDHKEMILVYEYMPNGTLADHLHIYAKRDDDSCSLTWKQRLNICIGAARGLDYLHTGHGVIHRDVKASNILLDDNFIAKVSDFGLAKAENQSRLQSHVSTKVKGTRGYLDPYYFSTRKLTRKSDTYAFGVVLLEVLCERQAIDPRFGEEEYCLTRWVQSKIKVGEVDQIVGSSLMEDILPDSLNMFVEIAERCLHDEPKRRPTMAQVVLQLESALELQEGRKIAEPNHNDVRPSNEDMMESEIDSHLVTDEHRSHQLQWSMRFKVIIGIAKGVNYLHHESRPATIHRDLKPTNILLDNGMNPKISGFGVARNIDDDQSELSTKIAGTLGYVAPEYVTGGRISEKIDVYSFGVVVLEILSGERNTQSHELLIEKAWRLWDEAKPFDLIDNLLGDAFSVDEALRCIQVGLLCTQEDPNCRPKMPSVLKILEGDEPQMDLKVEKPNPRPPAEDAQSSGAQTDEPVSTATFGAL